MTISPNRSLERTTSCDTYANSSTFAVYISIFLIADRNKVKSTLKQPNDRFGINTRQLSQSGYLVWNLLLRRKISLSNKIGIIRNVWNIYEEYGTGTYL